MIEEESRYFSLSGDIPVGGPSTWHITDWDQRRTISVTMDGEQEEEDVAIEHLSRHSSQLPANVYRIYVSDNGEIISSFTDPKDDQAYNVHYPSLQDAQLPDSIETIRRDELEELDRLGPDVDLVACPLCSNDSSKKVVFKYYWLWQYAKRCWDEMNIWMRLPRHRNIVPFDRVVLDEHEGRIVGFTNKYIPGGSIADGMPHVFRLEWLKQLTQVIDDLILRFGIAHQDVSPRNLAIDESTDSIMLFDFNFAARIRPDPSGKFTGYREERNDVKGVIFTMYEIITRDDSLRSTPHENQDVDSLGKEWKKHPEVRLDHPVAAYQELLTDWRKRRRLNVASALEVPHPITWPQRPEPPMKEVRTKDLQGRASTRMVDTWTERRQEVLERGGRVLNWERPPQDRLDGKVRMWCTGEAVDCKVID